MGSQPVSPATAGCRLLKEVVSTPAQPNRSRMELNICLSDIQGMLACMSQKLTICHPCVRQVEAFTCRLHHSKHSLEWSVCLILVGLLAGCNLLLASRPLHECTFVLSDGVQRSDPASLGGGMVADLRLTDTCMAQPATAHDGQPNTTFLP